VDPADAARPQRKRQARGERRMRELQDAAAEVFAEVGYGAATTNAIAARAGVSPGTLYQFYGNKEALAAALADRYLAALKEAHGKAFDTDIAHLSTAALVDRIVDPMIEVNLVNPGFKALFARADMPTHLASPTRQLQAAVLGRAEEVLRAYAPRLHADTVRRRAMVMVRTFAGLLPLVLDADEQERPKMIAEVKRAIRGYLDGQ
jgi:AcrR family transcriptional regulator